MTDTSPIYVVGSINTDLVVQADRLPAPGQTVLGRDLVVTGGGKGANQAVAAARLGARVAMVASVGTDAFGESARAGLEGASVETSFVRRDERRPSGVALITVDAAGENQITVAPGANAALDGDFVTRALEAIPSDAVVLIQLEIPLDTVATAVALAAARGCRVVLDPAPAQPLSGAILGGTYLLTPNETEAEALTGVPVSDLASAGEAGEALRAAGARRVAITLGAQGVLLVTDEGRLPVAAPVVDAIDTTAAGDCFNGALGVALSRGLGLAESAAFACRAAAVAVTRLGAQDAMPTARDLD